MRQYRGEKEIVEEKFNLGPDCGLSYIPHFISGADSDKLLESLKGKIEWEQDHFTMFGKKTPLPRLTAWYGDPEAVYTYSKIEMKPKKWIDPLVQIRDNLSEQLHVEFNSVLLNYYRNENDHMGWHRDNEKELGPKPLIASISLGDERLFQVRERKNKHHIFEINTGPGSLILMSGNIQTLWEHRIAKRAKRSSERINLTFRWVNPNL